MKHLKHSDKADATAAFCGAVEKPHRFAASVDEATCKPCVAVYRMTPASAFPECPSESVPTVYVEHDADDTAAFVTDKFPDPPYLDPEDYASAADDLAPAVVAVKKLDEVLGPPANRDEAVARADLRESLGLDRASSIEIDEARAAWAAEAAAKFPEEVHAMRDLLTKKGPLDPTTSPLKWKGYRVAAEGSVEITDENLPRLADAIVEDAAKRTKERRTIYPAAAPGGAYERQEGDWQP